VVSGLLAILVGKLVIQTKRCMNTMGVSAMRGQFGNLQNKGASNRILATNPNLFYLLSYRAGIEANTGPGVVSATGFTQ